MVQFMTFYECIKVNFFPDRINRIYCPSEIGYAFHGVKIYLWAFSLPGRKGENSIPPMAAK